MTKNQTRKRKNRRRGKITKTGCLKPSPRERPAPRRRSGRDTGEERAPRGGSNTPAVKNLLEDARLPLPGPALPFLLAEEKARQDRKRKMKNKRRAAKEALAKTPTRKMDMTTKRKKEIKEKKEKKEKKARKEQKEKRTKRDLEEQEAVDNGWILDNRDLKRDSYSEKGQEEEEKKKRKHDKHNSNEQLNDEANETAEVKERREKRQDDATCRWPMVAGWRQASRERWIVNGRKGDVEKRKEREEVTIILRAPINDTETNTNQLVEALEDFWIYRCPLYPLVSSLYPRRCMQLLDALGIFSIQKVHHT